MKVYGPYLRKDGRKHVVLVKDDGTRTTKSYPRVVMENFLGRELLPEETVDHINGDFTNDSIENLQLLSLEENARKSVVSAEYIQLVCKHCKVEFSRRKCIEERRVNIRKMDGPFCSKSCVGKVHH